MICWRGELTLISKDITCPFWRGATHPTDYYREARETDLTPLEGDIIAGEVT